MAAAIPPESAFPVAPPSSSLKTDVNTAFQSGDSGALWSLLPAAQGTSYVPKIIDAAKVTAQQTAPIENILQQVNSAGGVGSAKGNIAAAKAIEQSWADKQPEIGFIKGLAQGLMGNPNWRNAATQGVITSKPIFDENGQGATAFYAQNSLEPIRVVESGTNRPISTDEYEKRNFGKYSTYEQTPGVKQKAIQTEANATAFSAEQEFANVGKAVSQTIADNSANMMNGFTKIINMPEATQLTKKDIDELHSITTRSQTDAQILSRGTQALKSTTDSNSFDQNKSNINSALVAIGLKGIASYDGKNTFTLTDDTKISKSDLDQKMTTANSSTSQEKAFTQNKQDLIDSTVYKKLPYAAQVILDNILNQGRANQKLKDNFTSKYKESPLFTQSIPWEKGQPMAIGVGNALIDQMNSEIAAIYQDKVDTARKSGVPDRGEIIRATSSDPQVIAIKKAYSDKLDALQQTEAQRNAAETPVAAVAAPAPAASPIAKANTGTPAKTATQPAKKSAHSDILDQFFPSKKAK